jgi:hypothetical protein
VNGLSWGYLRTKADTGELRRESAVQNINLRSVDGAVEPWH